MRVPGRARAACLIGALGALAAVAGCQGSSAPRSAPSPHGPIFTPAQVRLTAAGAAPIGQSAYAVPRRAYFVAPYGHDTASGRRDRPWRTITHAVQVAPAGSTIVIRGGTYHEDVQFPYHTRLTIQPFPHEAVYLDGSVPVTGWQRTGAHEWVHAGWRVRFPVYADPAGAGQTFRRIDPAHPLAGHPDELFLDGRQLRQVAPAAALAPDDFAVDPSTHRLLLGSDPRGHQVRASTLTEALSVAPGAAGSVIRGIGIRRYATPISGLGTVKLLAPAARLVNSSVQDSAGVGVQVHAPGVLISHVSVTGSGELGIAANESDQLSIMDTRLTGNNRERFKVAPVSGGFKCTRCRGTRVAGSVISGNFGDGIWFDQSSYDVTVVGNVLEHDVGPALHFEISDAAVMANNVISDCGEEGIEVADATNAEMWNNTIRGCPTAISVLDGSRVATRPQGSSDPRYPPDPHMTWVTAGVDLQNNELYGGRGPLLVVVDYTHRRDGSQLVTSDGNVYGPRPGNQFALWSFAHSTTTLGSLAQYQHATGEDQHSQLLPIRSRSAVAAGPPPLVAAALHVPSGRRLAAGAWLSP